MRPYKKASSMQGVSASMTFLKTNDGIRRNKQRCIHYQKDGTCDIRAWDWSTSSCGNVPRCPKYEEKSSSIQIDIPMALKAPKEPLEIKKDYRRYKSSLDIGNSILKFQGCYFEGEEQYLVLVFAKQLFILTRRKKDGYHYYLRPNTELFGKISERIGLKIDDNNKPYGETALSICNLLKEHGVTFSNLADALERNKGKTELLLSDIKCEKTCSE